MGASETQTEKWRKKLGEEREGKVETKHRKMVMLTTLPQLFIAR